MGNYLLALICASMAQSQGWVPLTPDPWSHRSLLAMRSPKPHLLTTLLPVGTLQNLKVAQSMTLQDRTSVFLYISHLYGCGTEPPCGLIYIFLMTNDAEHLSMCLLALHISSVMKCELKF